MSWSYTPIWLLYMDEFRKLVAEKKYVEAAAVAEKWGIPPHVQNVVRETQK